MYTGLHVLSVICETWDRDLNCLDTYHGCVQLMALWCRDTLGRMSEYDSFTAESFAESSRALLTTSGFDSNFNVKYNLNTNADRTSVSRLEPDPAPHRDAKQCADRDLTPVEQQLVQALKESGQTLYRPHYLVYSC